jgi:hypothetical protein
VLGVSPARVVAAAVGVGDEGDAHGRHGVCGASLGTPRAVTGPGGGGGG